MNPLLCLASHYPIFDVKLIDQCLMKFPITALREIKLLKMLSHPNILQLKEMAIERSKGMQASHPYDGSCSHFIGEGRKKPSMYMVTPYMEHDLSGLLENPAVRFSESQIKCYMLQLLEGLKYLHAVLLSLKYSARRIDLTYYRTVFCTVI